MLAVLTSFFGNSKVDKITIEYIPYHCRTTATLNYASFLKSDDCKYRVEIFEREIIEKIEDQLIQDMSGSASVDKIPIKVYTVISLSNKDETAVLYMDCFGNCVQVKEGEKTDKEGFYTDLIYWFNTFSNQEHSSCL